MTVKKVLREAARRWRNKPFLIDAQKRWQLPYDFLTALPQTSTKYKTVNDTLAEVRCLFMGSIYSFFIEWLTCIMAGHIAAPANPLSSQFQIKNLLKSFTTNEIVFDKRFSHLKSIFRELEFIEKQEKDVNGIKIIRLRADESTPLEIDQDVWQFGFTSGTTGLQKIVPQTNKMALSVIKNLTSSYNITDKDIGLMVLPPWCVDSLVANVLCGASVGATTIALDRFNLEVFFQTIKDFQVTYSVVVPDILQWILDHPHYWSMLESVRFFITGGDLLPPEIHEEFMERTGIPIYLDWGMTETMGWGTLHPPENICIGSIGLPATDETNIRLVNIDTYADVASGESGTLMIKGPQLFSGYLGDNMPGQFYDGYFNTGDIARRDKEGFLFFVGRQNYDIAKYKGYYVDLGLLDRELIKIDGVKNACCIISPSMPGRRKIIAVVEKTKGVNISPDEILHELSKSYRRTISMYSKVSEVHIVRHLPQTYKNRPDRHAVKEMLMDIVSI